MSGRGLLSRLEGATGSVAPAPDVLDSIAAHLRVLLNARRGGSAVSPGYGIVDFTDLVHQFPSSIQVLQQSLRATILEFEPRLKNVTVRHSPDEDILSLKFEISGQLSEKGARGTLRFRTQMAAGGKFEVW